MGLQPDPSYLIFHRMYEYKGTKASYGNLFSLLSALGRGDPDFVNSLVVMINPHPDSNSDWAYTDNLEILMKILIDATYHIQTVKATSNWFLSDGDSPTNPYWTFYPYAHKTLGFDDIQFEIATTSWLITEVARIQCFVDVFSIPVGSPPVLVP